ncbi:MAG: hypothetical protein ACO2ZC_06065 [Pseudomonadales bacterium]
MATEFSLNLAGHPVQVIAEADDHLALYVDGCLRKRRQGTPCYLWTNVELPFEEHYLVEVRRRADAPLAVTVNGVLLASGTHINPQREGLASASQEPS